MKKSVLACLLGLMASSVYADMKIEVCFIPLREVVIDSVQPLLARVNIDHVFMRGNDGTGLNFQAINPIEIFGGKAEIGRQNYPTADCVTVFSTNDQAEYDRNWNNVVSAYEDIAIIHPYNMKEKNCLMATDEVVRGRGWEVPEALTSQLTEFNETWKPALVACSIQ